MKPATALLVALVFLRCSQSGAQQPPYWNDIQQFKMKDGIHPPQQHAILFVGSSSFTKWTDVQSYFPGYPIINRGFGGSTLLDVIHYASDVIFPYDAKQIVIYCGENDLAYVDTVTAATVLARVKTLFGMIRQKMPAVTITFVSIKPSPSRKSIRAKVEEANVLIKAFLASHPNTSFVDVFHPMLGTNGQPMPELFLGDSLHMKPAGYAIWQKAIEPYLMK